MRIAIVGSRDYPRMDLVAAYVHRDLVPGTVIVSGGARGVDRIAAESARTRGLEVVEHFADWDTHGRSAGFIRNGDIVKDSDQVVAFWDGESRGTRDTITKARKAGKLAWIIGPNSNLLCHNCMKPDHENRS